MPRRDLRERERERKLNDSTSSTSIFFEKSFILKLFGKCRVWLLRSDRCFLSHKGARGSEVWALMCLLVLVWWNLIRWALFLSTCWVEKRFSSNSSYYSLVYFELPKKKILTRQGRIARKYLRNFFLINAILTLHSIFLRRSQSLVKSSFFNIVNNIAKGRKWKYEKNSRFTRVMECRFHKLTHLVRQRKTRISFSHFVKFLVSHSFRKQS